MAPKLVSDNQGRETARLARGMNLERAVYQKALTDGTVEGFLRGLISSSLVYPDWVREHLTPELEAKALRDPGKVELWLHPSQSTGDPYPIGNEVYAAIKKEGLLERSLSLGHLQWYAENPDKIPADWRQRGLWVYGWASVVRHSDGDLYVPCLNCDVDGPCVYGYWLDDGWGGREPAGLSAS